jgi:hypothetical protein
MSRDLEEAVIVTGLYRAVQLCNFAQPIPALGYGHDQNRLKAGPNDSIAYVTKLLNEMAADPSSGITPNRVNLLTALLSRVMERGSVYPAITPDGQGGVSFEWSAKRWLVELELTSDGRFSLLHSGADGVVNGNIEGFARAIPLARVKRLVRDFSAFVVSQNPMWREYFA